MLDPCAPFVRKLNNIWDAQCFFNLHCTGNHVPIGFCFALFANCIFLRSFNLASVPMYNVSFDSHDTVAVSSSNNSHRNQTLNRVWLDGNYLFRFEENFSYSLSWSIDTPVCRHGIRAQVHKNNDAVGLVLLVAAVMVHQSRLRRQREWWWSRCWWRWLCI